MKKYVFLIALTLVIYSCGLVNNGPENRPVDNMNRDYILINETPYNDLHIYVSRLDPAICNNFTQITSLRLNARYAFHVSPGETVYVKYCTPDDQFCSGCRMIKLVGNSGKQGNEVHLGQN